MSIGAMLEVGIGLIFVFLVLGLIVSALQEAVAALFGLRSKYLLEGLSTILAEKAGGSWKARRHILPWSTKRDEGSKLFKAVANHALVNGITPSKIPSYIPAANFATALIETLKGTGTGPVANQIEKAIGGLDGPAKEALSALFVDAKGDVDIFKKSVETWFDGAMDRISGIYKRWTQYFALIAGVVIAIAINANSIEITRALWHDPALRATAMAAAEQYIADCRADPTKCPGAAAVVDPAADPVKAAEEASRRAKELVTEVRSQLTAIGYPIGWTEPPQGRGWVIAILGWLITGLAVSLGAPFWFDMLKTFVNVRGGKKPEEPAPTK